MKADFDSMRYRLRIVVPGDDLKEENVLADLTSLTPFMTIRAGEGIWPESFQSTGLENRPEPYEYKDELIVSKVKHAFFRSEQDGKSQLEHQVEAVIQDPYAS